MALNKYMHSRNIYKTPPDFGKLQKMYPEFSAIAKVDVVGKVTIDFKDPQALRVLTTCLLKSDFNLEVDIPDNRLVPTLPLRLNYILWIEDLLTSIQRNENICGIDIGTGACAIYPLLAAVKNKWNMHATESDLESYNKAEENVTKNNLLPYIKLWKNTTETVVSHIFTEENKQIYDFCMCNPPFYSTIQELYESRSPARVAPKNGFTGSPQELITKGGELEFCRNLIQESKAYKDNVLIFTTMVGHKYNLSVLANDLKVEGIRHTHTEFCQGRVTRWGLAWTYKDYDLSYLVPPRDKPRKKPTSTLCTLPLLKNGNSNFDGILQKFKDILNKLNVTHTFIEKRGNSAALDIVALKNTWSNQRRKRRLMKRLDSEAKIAKTEDNLPIQDAAQTTEAPNPTNSCNNENVHKHSVSEDADSQDHAFVVPNSSTDQCLVHAFLKLSRKENEIQIEMEFLDGSAGKEGLHQITQYIKNNWKYFFVLFIWQNHSRFMVLLRLTLD